MPAFKQGGRSSSLSPLALAFPSYILRALSDQFFPGSIYICFLESVGLLRAGWQGGVLVWCVWREAGWRRQAEGCMA